VSKEIDIVLSAYRAFRVGDEKALGRLVARDFTSPSVETTSRAPKGVRAYVATLRDTPGAPFHPDPAKVSQYGNRVVAIVRNRVHGPETGVRLKLPIAHVWSVHRGKITGFQTFRNRRDAIRAAKIAFKAEVQRRFYRASY
jgi:ketosteroid isomerase-like protein